MKKNGPPNIQHLLAGLPAGMLPPYLLGAEIRATIVPPDAWTEAHREELNRGERPPMPPDEECMVSFSLVGTMVYTSSIVPMDEWKGDWTTIAPIWSVPFKEFKARIDKKIAGVHPTIPAPSDGGAGGAGPQ